MSAEGPACSNVAPQSPPIRAWEEEEGRPHHQVMRFQAMAPIRLARMTQALMAMGSAMPPLMAFATWVPNTKAAMKLKNAAQTTAAPGVRTRVETTVAMELAAS